MAANTFVQTVETQELAARWFEEFLAELTRLAPRFGDSEADIYLYCHLAPEGEPSRRVMVVTDRRSPLVRVCIEAAYELFQGDIHHYVQRVGTVNRDEVESGLAPLVREAYSRLIAWKPTHENIWDHVF